jgi:hypothetical protein
LPSSLAWVLSRALGYSPRPPESVCGTDTKEALCAAFLGSLGSSSARAKGSTPSPLGHVSPGLSLSGPQNSTYRLGRGRPTSALDLPSSVPAHFNATLGGAGILTCFPSPTPLGLGLGSDSPSGGLSFPGKPWAYGDRVSRSVYRYSCLHKLFSGPIPVVTVRRVSTRECSPTALSSP